MGRLIRFVTLLLFSLLASTSLLAQNVLFVSPSGSDSGDGSASFPFKTIQKAIDAVRALDKSAPGSTTVTIREGTYYITNPLLINEAAGGSNLHRVIFRAADDNVVWVRGGINITGWAQVTGKPYYRVTLNFSEIRDIYVNGERRQRARTNERITGLNWVKSGTIRTGILIDKADLPAIVHPGQLELHMQSDWRDAYVPVNSMLEKNGVWELYSNRINEVTRMSPILYSPSFSKPFFIENALELLDMPGEWCYDRTDRTLYYYPMQGEDISSLEIIVPVCDKLLEIKGTSPDSKVKSVTIEGIRFANTSWNAPSNEGWFGAQGEMILRPSGFIIPPAAVEINNANSIIIQNCQIRNTAVLGLSMPNGVSGARIEGCYFFDNGAAAIMVSNKNLMHEDVSGEETPRNDTIKNNLIVRAGAVYYQTPAISSYYTDGLIIDHNTIMQVSYSAISSGLGWGTINSTCRNNKITCNRIADYVTILRDAGGVYTNGNQWNSVCDSNYISNGYDDYAGLYFDEGSCFFTARNNVEENTIRWLHIWTTSIHDITLSKNWATNSAQTQNGINIKYEAPIIVSDGNWPAEARAVMDHAGFSPKCTWLTALIPDEIHNPPEIIIPQNSPITVSITDPLTLKAEISGYERPFGILKMLWRKKSGPGTVTFPDAQLSSTPVSFSAPGTYELEILATYMLDTAKKSIQVVVTPGNTGTDIARGGIATASSSYDPVNTIASKGIDGNINSCWVSASTDSDYPVWTLDFRSTVRINRLELDSRRGYNFPSTRSYLVFEASDESSFLSPKTIAYQGKIPFDYQGTWTFNFPEPVECRFLRIIHSVPGSGTVAEFRAFGEYIVPFVAVNAFSLNPSHAVIRVGEDTLITGTIIPENATNKNITWKSSSPDVAFVNQAGLVTGQSRGTSQITASLEDGKEATSIITVEENPAGLNIYPNPLSNGELNVRFRNDSGEEFIIFISDSTGKTVFRTSTRGNIFKINREFLRRGIYIVCVLKNNGIKMTSKLAVF